LDFGATLYEDDAQGFNLMRPPDTTACFFRATIRKTFSSAAQPPAIPTAAKIDAERILDRNRQITYLVGPEWHFEFHSLTGQLDSAL